MLASTWRMQAAWATRAPLTSTAHTRQTATGESLGSWQSTGMSIPSVRAASQMVVPSGTVIVRSSMVSVKDDWVSCVCMSAIVGVLVRDPPSLWEKARVREHGVAARPNSPHPDPLPQGGRGSKNKRCSLGAKSPHVFIEPLYLIPYTSRLG